MNSADHARGFAVLLHPHPHFGGDRFHPFIDTLFRRLPEVAISAIRFDYSSAELATARKEVVAAIDVGAARWPELPVILVGYSFGAGIAAAVGDGRIIGWYLLAPPAAMLSDAPIADDPRPKVIVVPQYDQFSPPAAVGEEVSGWEATTLATAAKADHFLGNVDPLVESALRWIGSVTGPTCDGQGVC